MKKVCKIRFYPNKSQIDLINGTLGCCRYVSNKYIAYNEKMHANGHPFISAYEFSKIINKMKKNNPECMWMAKYSSKAIQDAIMQTEKSFKKFFKKKGGISKVQIKEKDSKGILLLY